MSKPLSELVERDNPAWPEVQHWIREGQNEGVVHAVERADGERALSALQISTKSSLGAIALESGGVAFDQGWLQFLGARSAAMPNGLVEWNGLAVGKPTLPGALIVAVDVLGGIFAMDGGAFGQANGDAWYFAPDSLSWEPTEMGYTALLRWAADGDVETFYEPVRWSGWEDEVAALKPGEGFSFEPPLWTLEGKPLADASRKAVPLQSLFALMQELARQLSGK